VVVEAEVAVLGLERDASQEALGVRSAAERTFRESSHGPGVSAW
jgi:hypothetical protein